jgi:hypothetical protein
VDLLEQIKIQFKTAHSATMIPRVEEKPKNETTAVAKNARAYKTPDANADSSQMRGTP